MKGRSRSDHKHEYEDIVIDAHSYMLHEGRKTPFLYCAKRCKVCGRLAHVNTRVDLQTPPAGVPLYEVADLLELMGLKTLPAERVVTA